MKYVDVSRFGSLLHLRVGEGEPDFAHLVGSEEAVDNLDVRAQEGHVLQPVAENFGGAAPHAGPLDVHADEVLVGIESCQPHGIFAASAAQFQHDGIRVLEETACPTAPHFAGHVLGHRIRIFKHVRIIPHISKFF
jgi:hypothetical protein